MMRPILALGASQIIGYGSLYHAFPLLVPHIAAEFGRSETTLFAVFSVGLLCGGMAAPRLGRLFDRIGAPRVMAAGSLAAAVTLSAIALSPGFAIWVGLMLSLEIVAAAVLYDAAFAALVRITGPGGRTAITRLTLIAGFASTLFWPLTDALIAVFGWRGTVGIFALLHGTIALGLHLWLAQLPAAVPIAATAPSAAAGPSVAVPPWGFAAVAASFALTGMLVSALGVHMVPVLMALGLGAGAPLVAMLMGPAQVTIRLINALFWSALHPLTVATIALLALPIAVASLLAGLPAWQAAPLFAGLFGVGQGLNSIVRGAVPLALFGAGGYGARLGRLALVVSFSSAGAPFAFAALHGAIGLYPTLWGFLVIGVLAAVPILLLRARLLARY
jgi:hypothetical protein